MPTSPSNGLAWRGRRACQCVIDATADYEKLAKSSLIGYIYQACYSHAAASAGTHALGGALDTIQLTDRGVRVASSVGFWPSNRFKWQGFDSDHAHWVLLGDPHASAALKAQMVDLRNGRDGLARHGADRHGHLRPHPILTYAQWKASQQHKGQMLIGGKWHVAPPSVNVGSINRARAGRWVSGHVWYVQSWLRKLGYYKSPLDGKWGPVTQAALDRFRRHIGFSGKGATGTIGFASLKKLHDLAHSSKPIAK